MNVTAAIAYIAVPIRTHPWPVGLRG